MGGAAQDLDAAVEGGRKCFGYGLRTEEEKMRAKRDAVRIGVLLAIVVVLIVCQNEIGNLLDQSRAELKKLPLSGVIPVFLVISAVRRLVPPTYYIVPVGTLFTMYCCDKLGAYRGALVYQLVKLQEIPYFYLLRWLFSGISTEIFDGERDIWWLSTTLRSGARGVDKAWRDRLVGRPILVQATIIVAFGLAMYMEDYVNPTRFQNV